MEKGQIWRENVRKRDINKKKTYIDKWNRDIYKKTRHTEMG